MAENNLEAALALARRGWRVYRVHTVLDDGRCSCKHDCGKDKAKHPVDLGGCTRATTDLGVIRDWYRTSKANVGVAPGKASKLLVLDIDPRNGGTESLAKLEAGHGPLPRTPTVASGGGGRHYYFAWPKGVKMAKAKLVLGPGLDLLGEGSGCVAPPSLHASGNRYRWEVSPDEAPLAEAPPWLLALAREAAGQDKGQAKAGGPAPEGVGPKPGPLRSLRVEADPPGLAEAEGVDEGRRHGELLRLIGRAIGQGQPLERVEAEALAWASRCKPALPEAEAVRQVRSVWAKEQAKRERTNEGSPAEAPPPPDPSLVSSFARSFVPSSGGSDGTGQAEAGVRSFVRSDGEAAAEGEGLGCVVVVTPGEARADDWPKLGEAAYHGIAGAAVKAVAPETEADPAGILLSLLAGFGSCVGPGPHFAFEADRHAANLYVAKVGNTGSGKGPSWGLAKYPLAKADPGWARHCLCHGLGSGEGLVERLADVPPLVLDTGDGEARDFALPGDKRLYCVEEELARVFGLMQREGSTLSSVLRSAWDGEPMEFLNRAKGRLRATGTHVSVEGHITREELAECVEGKGRRHLANGWTGRFLWCVVRRSKLRPFGGNVAVLDAFAGPLAEAIARAKGMGELKRTAAANALWEASYPRLAEDRDGDYGKATAKGKPQTMRLALIFALLDMAEAIDERHLAAALAVWDYCDASARLIFGEARADNNTPHPPLVQLALTLGGVIARNPGVSRSQLHDATGRNHPAEDRAAALAWLEERGMAHRRRYQSGGRPGEGWFPGPAPDDPDDGPDAVTRERGNAESPASVQGGASPSATAETRERENAGTREAPAGQGRFPRSRVSEDASPGLEAGQGQAVGEGQAEASALAHADGGAEGPPPDPGGAAAVSEAEFLAGLQPGGSWP